MSQVVGAPCWLGTLPSVLLDDEQSPKMLKMASRSFIHGLLLFLGLFLKISRLFLFFLLMVVTLFFILLYCEMVVDV